MGGIMKYSNTEVGISGRKMFGRIKNAWIWAALVLVIVAIVSGCIEERRQDSLNFGTSATLTIDKAPALNQTAELTLTISAVRNFSNISARIILPEGLEFLSGNLYWHGELKKNQTQSIHAKVRAIKTGKWTIIGAATGKNDYIYLSIQENAGHISETPFINFTRGKKNAEAK